ncbi:ABC transporter ATP-binding protein [Brevibacillus daliensis]|uniref:ABC transporter ATP-binding protein n=1 Tax=Brevibacillus daliensis TaxID=2892995 RepID=UPI001E326EC3|nr:ABC transporter ATP-binding protein [Brevibacillus daliensis]
MITHTSSPSKIELRHVTHLYVTSRNAFMAVKDISLTVKEGEFISLVGPSGCGKTTLLSLIAGLEKATRGNVLLDGEEVSGTSRKVGYMLQHDYLFGWRTIEENIYIGLEVQGTRSKETEEYALHLLEDMDLLSFRNSFPQQLSGGMRQRVALVRTLACKPDILLLDEPFSALDHQTKLKLEDLIIETLRRHKKTAVLVTHDLQEAVAMGDRVFVLDRTPGTIRREIEIPEVLRRLLPFGTRQQDGFTTLYNQVWREMEGTSDGATSN